MAFDLPTQLGLDSDDPRCLGEVGRTGVAIDTIDDMRTAFDGIPLDQVSTSMTINAPASVLLLLYELVGEEQGVPAEQLRGTTQNDILKEYIARGNFIYPPEGAIRLTTDLFAYCQERVPKWNTISISGYHFREKGCSAVQEVAFTLANGIAYVQAALDAGLAVDEFAPRLAFFFNGHNNVFQEVAKFRAARRMWAEIMRERFGAKDERSWRLRFHTQTGGVTLTAQQPENNIVRVALQGFAAVCGGTQSLHTNGFDEALALPTERAAKIALRTQQIIGYESGAADTVDPFAGSYFVEALTDEIETSARELIAKVDELGGSVNAIDFIKNEIEESAFGYHERYRIGQDIVVGVNKFVEDDPEVPDILRVDPESEREQVERLKAFKADRDGALVEQRLEEIRDGGARDRQPAAGAAAGAQGPLLAGRGVRRDARRLRRVPADVLSPAAAPARRRDRGGTLGVAGAALVRAAPIPDTTAAVHVWDDQLPGLDDRCADPVRRARTSTARRRCRFGPRGGCARSTRGSSSLYYRLGIGDGPVPFRIGEQWASDYGSVTQHDSLVLAPGGRRVLNTQSDWYVMNPDSGWRSLLGLERAAKRGASSETTACSPTRSACRSTSGPTTSARRFSSSSARRRGPRGSIGSCASSSRGSAAGCGSSPTRGRGSRLATGPTTRSPTA